MSSPQDQDPPAEPAVAPAADADPPTEMVPEQPVAEEPVGTAAVVGEPDSAGPGELHDADPPTVAEPEVEQVAEPSAEPPSEEAADADPPTRPVDGAEGEPADGAAAEDTAADEEIESGELPELDDEELDKALEALLLVVDSPVEEDVLATALSTDLSRVTGALDRMAARLGEQERGFDLRRAGGGWRFYTRDRYAPYVEKMLLDGQRAKLTRAALETLAVIAYRQPVTRARVAAVRGVNCDGVIRTLLARGLVEETGTDLETGGFLYRTTELFLERLGLSSLEDLPPIAPLLPEVDSIDDV